jgi:hypothetical protein
VPKWHSNAPVLSLLRGDLNRVAELPCASRTHFAASPLINHSQIHRPKPERSSRDNRDARCFEATLADEIVSLLLKKYLNSLACIAG